MGVSVLRMWAGSLAVAPSLCVDDARMDLYGLPYMGSKSRFAGRICSILPRGDRLVDLFAGGCAVTDFARQCGKWQRVLAIDADPRPLTLYEHCLACRPLDWSYISRERYAVERDRLDYAQIMCWGYGAMGRGYVYSREEAAKMDLILAYIGDGAEMAGAPSFDDARQRLMWCLGHGVTDHSGRIIPYSRLLRLQSLGRCSTQLWAPAQVATRTGDWRSYEPQQGDVVYADPPYVGTAQGAYVYRHWTQRCRLELVDRLRSYGVPVYLSEYTAPTADAECVARWPVKMHLRTGYRCERVECLWRVA